MNAALNRRQLLQGSVAFAAFAWLPDSRAIAQEAAAYHLDIRPGQAELLEAGGPKTSVWGYNGIVPGPLLRVKRGQQIDVSVTNHLPQPTSVHWHGLRIDNAMDGVAGLTQAPIAPGETFDYSFVPPDAGTHWYHSHQRGWEQVARGLYGPLIVDEDELAGFDRELVIMADDWRLREDGGLDQDSLGNLADRAHGGRLGNVLTLNSKPYESLKVQTGERVRLRLINSANARIMQFRLAGVDAWIVALDGQPVAPLRLAEHALRLAPAQRADLAFDVRAAAGTELAISEVSGQEPLVTGYLQVAENEGPERETSQEPPRLPANNVPMPDVANARIIDLNMTGGAMRGLQTAVYKGKTYDGRTLAREHGQAWAMNGAAGTTVEPLFSAAQGESIVIRMKNDTAWPHAMHLHGHHFLELARKPNQLFDNSVAGALQPETAPLRDTVLMQPDETVDIGFFADNPGSWLLHCHMLEHMAGGMVTWFEIRG